MTTSTTTAEPSAKLRAATRLPEPLAALALLVLASAFAGLSFARPRAIEPSELPSLELSRSEVASVIEADQRAARNAPHVPAAEELRKLLTKEGEMELIGAEKLEVYNERRDALAKGYSALSAAVGEAAAMRLRAEAVSELDRALDLELPMARAKIVIGTLSQMLEREGASFAGELTAPRFVVRTLYKARWNLLHGLAPALRFERIELQAYYGWEALHAERLPVPQRVEALRAYAKAGGRHAEEALGVLYYRHEEYEQAVGAFRSAYNAAPGLRLRNYLLGAEVRAGLHESSVDTARNDP